MVNSLEKRLQKVEEPWIKRINHAGKELLKMALDTLEIMTQEERGRIMEELERVRDGGDEKAQEQIKHILDFQRVMVKVQ